MSKKIIDAFLFYNELDVLEIRLQELYPVVDEFVIIEASKTFTGLPKPLFYQENQRRYKKYSDKVRHVVLDNLPETDDPWEREYFQRNYISTACADYANTDIIIISDADEIPKRESVEQLRQMPFKTFLFKQTNSRFYLNYIEIATSVQSVAVIKEQLATNSANELRMSNWRRSWRASPGPIDDETYMFEDAGWHLSYLGDQDNLALKLKSYSHQEFNNPDYTAKDINQSVRSEEDFFGIHRRKWLLVPSDLSMPHRVKERVSEFEHYFLDYNF